MTAGEDHLLWSGSRHRRLATRARPGTSPTFGPVHNDRDGQDIRGSINWTFTDYSGATGGDSPAFAWSNRQIVDSAVRPRPLGLENHCWSRSLIVIPVSYTHLRAHETDSYLVCRLL